MATIVSTISGIAFAATSKTIVTNTDLPWWAILLIAIVPTILGVVCDLITTWLKNKGYISSETKDKIDSAVDEVIDKTVDTITGEDKTDESDSITNGISDDSETENGGKEEGEN